MISSMHATRPSEMREAFQSADALYDGLRDASCGLWAALGDEVADPFEVVRGVRRPADAHQPRYRRSMRDTTSSCSTRRPSLAEARPFSTSTRNHSSWSIELAKRSSATWSTVRPVSVARRVNFASSSGGTCKFIRQRRVGASPCQQMSRDRTSHSLSTTKWRRGSPCASQSSVARSPCA